jgi:hypothetical protein
MHIKINKALLDPNFLPLILWSKTSLKNQHIHLELLYILSYPITYKTKHKIRINISDSYKIMVNSQKMYLVIRRQYPEGGQ